MRFDLVDDEIVKTTAFPEGGKSAKCWQCTEDHVPLLQKGLSAIERKSKHSGQITDDELQNKFWVN
jgi:hypothetical protein